MDDKTIELIVVALGIVGLAMIAFRLLRWMYPYAKRFMGWIGPYILATAKMVGLSLLTHKLFGIEFSEITGPAIACALFMARFGPTDAAGAAG